MRSKTDTGRSALLVIDAQDSFKVGPRWPRRNNPDFKRNVGRLVDGYRAAGLPVFFFLHRDEGAEWRPGSPHFKLMDFIAARRGEPVLTKTTRNCFTGTDLDALLRRADLGRVTVAGIKTEECCETTARVAADLGYEVDFVTEATLTFPIAHPSSRDELSAEEVVRRTEYALRDRFARVITVDSLLAELRATAGLRGKSSALPCANKQDSASPLAPMT